MSRDPWFDNAKMALVTLVVVGHAYVLLPGSEVRNQLYDFLYFWHVPAFVFVTGYLSRSFSYTRRRMWMLLRTVVVPYLLFECLMALFRIYVGGERLADLFRDPHWPMWYLSALFFWRLMTPAFRAMRGAVPVAIAISLLAGVYAGDTLDFARVFGLLPFFVLGLHATPERLAVLKTGRARVVGVLALTAVFVLALNLNRFASTEWLYYRSRYADLDVTDLQAFGIRAVVMVAGAIGAFGFLTLIPNRAGWFTRLGGATLIVYLCHGFFVKGAEYAGYSTWAGDHPVLAYPVTTLAAVALALLLAWRPVADRLQHLVDPLGLAQARYEHAVEVAGASARADHIEGVIEDVIDEASQSGPADRGESLTALR